MMIDILNDLSEEALTQAIEANLFEVFRLMRNWPKAEMHEAPELFWSITDIPFFMFNSVLRAQLAPERIEPTIQAAVQRGQNHQVPIGWYVGPQTQPPDLGTYLKKHGFSSGEPQIGMAIDLQSMNESLPVTSTLTLSPVNDAETLHRWCQVCVSGFEMPDFTIDYFYEWFLSLGFGPSSPIRNYLGWLNGEVVATSTLLPGAGVAGIYCVATLPQARRLGVGAAMTLHPLQDARRMGYRIGILQASEMGFPIYRKIGFKEYCQIKVYVREVQARV